MQSPEHSFDGAFLGGLLSGTSMFLSAKRAGFVVLLAVLALLPACALAGRKHGKAPKVRQQIMQLEEQWRTAQLSGDAASMDQLLSDDYVGITATGEVRTKAQQLDRMRSHDFTLTRLDVSDTKIKLVGAVAIVTSLAQFEGTNQGKPVQGSSRYTRVYQRLGTGLWKITNFEATHIPTPHAHNPKATE